MIAKADSEGTTSINSITQSSSGLPAPLSTETSQEITHPYACFRCSKRFSSWHALGGHQNAHKKERHEEHRLYSERRLALKKKSPVISIIPSTPKPPLILNAQPEIAVLAAHYSPVVGNYGPMVQMQSFGPAGFIYNCDNGPVQAPVFMPVNEKVMALNLFGHGDDQRGFKAFAEGSSEDAAADDDQSISKKKKEVDLTLRL